MTSQRSVQPHETISRTKAAHGPRRNSVVSPSGAPSDTFGICGARFRGREWPICCYTLILLLIVLLLVLSGCSTSRVSEREASAVARITAGGDAAAGRIAIRAYGCATCHTIRGIEGGRGLVGPPLNGVRDRMTIAGELPNTPENLIRWIQHPHTVEPNTIMPDMNISEDDGRNIAAYLYTLR